MTKLTRNQHLAMANCLKAAKLLLPTTRRLGVCFAIKAAQFDYKTKKLVLKWIDDQLGEYLFVTGWLYNRTGEDLCKIQAQKYRHAWVDHMIKVLES